jgi:hypothetical protein
MSGLQAWERILFEWKQVHRLKCLNQRLYDQLGGSIIHIVRYAEENNIPLPHRDKLYELVDKAENIIDEINAVKLSDENLQPSESDKDFTRPYFRFCQVSVGLKNCKKFVRAVHDLPTIYSTIIHYEVVFKPTCWYLSSDYIPASISCIMGEITLKGFVCERCSHKWVPREDEIPKVCPKCKSPYWNTPRKLERNRSEFNFNEKRKLR